MASKHPASTAGPDSGWSWVIAGSCCFINMMMYGMMRLAGVLFVATFEKFPVSRQKASFPYSLSSTMRNASGPLVGLLGHKFGVRFTTAAGALLGTIGIALCFCAQDVIWITIFWGGVFGMGFGLGNVLLPVSINEYFDKYRATASGISLSGACLGSFFLPPLVDILLKEYGLNGTFLIISGLVLNCVPVALLLRKPTFSILNSNNDSNLCSVYKESNKNSSSKSNCSLKQKHMVAEQSPKDVVETYYLNPSFVPDQVFTITKTGNSEAVNTEMNLCKDKWMPEDSLNLKNSIGELEISKSEIHDLKKPTEKYPIDNSRTCTNVSITYQQSHIKNTSRFQLEDTSSQVPTASSQELEERGSWKKFIELITNPMFILISVSVALYGFTFVCMMTAIVDFAMDVGIEQSESKYVIMCFSVGDLIGRLGLGWVTDRGYMTKATFTAMCFFLQGVAAVCAIWSFDFLSLSTIMCVYGIFEAGMIIMFPLLVAQYVEQKLQTVAIASSNVLYGPACLAVPITIGFFREQHGSYDGVFLTVGFISAVCGIAWLAVSFSKKCRVQK